MDWESFCRRAYALGFAKAGLCKAAPFAMQREEVAAQPALSERRQLRFEPEEDNYRTKSLAVLLYPYVPYEAAKDDEVFVDAYYEASNAAYHAASMLEKEASAAGRFIRANVPYPAKAAAVRAGLGVIGKNSLLITQEYGTRVVIILFATDFETGEQAIAYGGSCLECGRCYQACPSGALDEHGMSHPERCLRNFIMEGSIMPQELRMSNGNRMIGCDICQRVCPLQRINDKEKKESPHLTLSEFMTENPGAFSASVKRLAELIGRNTARPQRVRAQAALIAGVRANPAYIPVLSAWAEMPFEAVSVHSRWAIERCAASGEVPGNKPE